MSQGKVKIITTEDGSHTLYHEELQETYHSFHGAFRESIQLLNRAMNLAYYAHLGDPQLYWQEFEQKASCSTAQLSSWAQRLLREDQASVLYYQSI